MRTISPQQNASLLAFGWGRRLISLVLLLILGFSLPFIPLDRLRLIGVGLALTVFMVFLLLDFASGLKSWQQDRAMRLLQDLLSEDVAPCFATEANGIILYRNRAAMLRNPIEGTTNLAHTLLDTFAEPQSVLTRLMLRADRHGATRGEVVTRRGLLRLSVHRLSNDAYLWRYEELGERGPLARGGDGLSMPMLVADASGAIILFNQALRQILGARPRTLEKLFGQQEVHSGHTVTVQGAGGAVQAVVIEIAGAAGRREIYLLPLAELPGFGAGEEGFENLPVALVHLDASGRVLLANKAAREHLNVSEDEEVNASELFEGLGRPVREWVADVALGRQPGRTEMLSLSRSEDESFVQLTLRRLPHALGEGVLAVVSDATEHKALEAQFVQSQKMQAIGQLAGGIAHDFNNLLTAISGHCDLLMLHHDQDDPDYPDLAQIRQNTNRAADLVGQLLAFSRKQTMQPTAVNMNDALVDVTHLLNRLVEEKVQLQLDLADPIGAIRTDRRQLEQVMMNLVVNARDAMPGGGVIKIQTKNIKVEAETRISGVLLPQGDYVCLLISDTGTGIAPDRMDKIFEPFYTTKRQGEGTGLGLSTVYGIVKQSGGYIFVESILGEGTTFTLYFPQCHIIEVAEPKSAPPAQVMMPQRHGTILLVEDEAPVRAFAARALRLRGHTVVEANCGEDALALLEDEALKVDVMVTDVIMPGLDGPTWIKKALVRNANVGVIFMSGYAEESFSGAQQDIARSTFLPKPFTLEELTRTVQSKLNEAAA